MGQPITVGTGMFDLKQDISKTLVYGSWYFKKITVLIFY